MGEFWVPWGNTTTEGNGVSPSGSESSFEWVVLCRQVRPSSRRKHFLRPSSGREHRVILIQSGDDNYLRLRNETRRKHTTGTQCPTLFDKWHHSHLSTGIPPFLGKQMFSTDLSNVKFVNETLLKRDLTSKCKNTHTRGCWCLWLLHHADWRPAFQSDTDSACSTSTVPRQWLPCNCFQCKVPQFHIPWETTICQPISIDLQHSSH